MSLSWHLLWILAIWASFAQAAQPRFLPRDPVAPNASSAWRPSLDSLDSRLHNLNGNWTWSAEEGGGGSCVVPGCWSGHEGELLFTRSFALPEKGVQSVWRLWFGGVSYACRVSVNGKFLDRHEGGSDPFELEIPEGVLLFGGANTLEVRVDNRLSARQTVPLKTQSGDPTSYGGIYRDVWLMESPRLRLTDLSWGLQGQGTSARLALAVQVRNQELLGVDSLKTAPDVAVEALLRGPAGEILATGSQVLRARAQESMSLRLLLAGAPLPRWSPQNPQLLDLSVALTQGGRVLHRLRQKVGVKELGQQGGRLHLNGEPFFLQGISYVADHPVWGMAMPVSQVLRDLESMKNMGVNTVLHMRGAPHPALAELCDRLGLLLVTELPVWQVPPRLVARDSFRQAALAQARNLVLQGRSHACWLGLSLGSGLDFSDAATAEWIRQVQVLRQDGQFALTAGGFFSHEGMAPDPQGLDFLLLEPFGQRARHETPALKLPVVLSRVGWPVEIGNLEGYEHPYGELHQAWAIQSTVGAALGAWQSGRAGAPAGTVVHSFADWRGGRPLLAAPPGQDPLLVSLGLHNEDRVARSGAKELARLYSGEAASTLSRGEYEPQHPPAFPLAGFALLILLLIGWKQNNVFGQNLRRSFIHSHGFFTDIRDRRVFQFGQAMFILVLVSGALALVGSGWLHLLRKSPYLDHVLGLMVVQEPLLQWIHRLAWNPMESMVQLALALMGGQILFALGLRVLGLLTNARFTFRQAITLLAWSSTSLLFTLPIGIVFQPLMQNPGARGLTLFLLSLLALWHAVRLFKALRIAFEGRFWGMFALMTVLGLALLVLVLVWYERSQSLFEYMDYYQRVYGGGA
jgi:hypothetical protein